MISRPTDSTRRKRAPTRRRQFHHLHVVRDTAPALSIPDVTGMSNLDAALAYAEAGWYVMAIAPRSKRPARTLGNRWHLKTTRDADTIRRWWTRNPRYGVGLHVGRSGALAFDFDDDDLDVISRDGRPKLTKALRSAGGILGTRRIGERGHYLFAVAPDDDFGNSAGVFMRYGEVRGRNGYIVVAPTKHPGGGHYRQSRTGQLTPLPSVLRDCLSEAGDHADPKTPVELVAFLGAHVGDERPSALKGQLSKFAAEIADGASRHDSMTKAVVWAFREAIVECYPAQRAYDELRTAFEDAKPERGPEEFDRIAAWAASQAELADPDETRARLDRNVWPGPDTPHRVAEHIAEHAAKTEHPIRYWREQFWRYTGTHYAIAGKTAVRTLLYDLLRDAVFEKKDGTRAPWNPDKARIDKVIDALKSVVSLPDSVQPPCWLDGRDTRVIPCGNGLVRPDDRRRLRHDPLYFSTFALPFDYTRSARCPRWLRFIREIFPGDTESAEALQEWFGYVLSGRTDLHKMVMLIGPTRSGKGTIDKVLEALVGDGHVGMSAGDLKGQFGLQPILGKSLVVFSDERVTVDGKRFVETLLRITGEDAVTVDVKYAEPWRGRLGARLMFMSNEPPGLPDSSRAIVGRLLVLHMPVSWLNREDRDLTSTVRDELPGVLNWALDGLDRVTARGHFHQPASGAALISLLAEGASPVTQFVEERCTLADQATVPKDDLYEAWKRWCDGNGHNAGSREYLSRKLFAAFGATIGTAKLGGRGRQRPYYTGVALIPEHPKHSVPYRSGS